MKTDPRKHRVYGTAIDHIVAGLERGAPLNAVEAFTLAGRDVLDLIAKGVPRDQLRDWLDATRDRPKTP